MEGGLSSKRVGHLEKHKPHVLVAADGVLYSVLSEVRDVGERWTVEVPVA